MINYLSLSRLTLMALLFFINSKSALLTNSYDQYLTHYWPICDSTINDEVGSAHISRENISSFASDRFGNGNSALSLNSSWTQVPNGIYFETPEFTISVWVMPQEVGYWARVIDFANGHPLDNIVLSLNTGGGYFQPNFQIYDGNNQVIQLVSTNSPLIMGKWQFLTATFNGTVAKLYIDGQLKAFVAKSLTMRKLVRSQCFIGKSHWSEDGYSMSYLDELRFFNKSLLESEINELMMNNNETSSKFKKKEFYFNESYSFLKLFI